MTHESSVADIGERAEVAEMKHGANDTAKKFTIRVRSGSGNEWNEDYTARTDNPEQWGRDIVAFWNRTLRPHETPREFVSVTVHGEVPPPEHDWFKVTAMTQQRGDNGRPFDKMQCERCGVTGKRFGISATVNLDSVWRAKVYRQCDTTIAHQESKRK